MNREIIELTWMDAQSLDIEPSLVRKEDVAKLNGITCSIVGYLVDENVERYVLAKEVWENGYYKYLHIIPKKSVISFRKLNSYSNFKGDKLN